MATKQKEFLQKEEERNKLFDEALAKVQDNKVSVTFKAISNIEEGCVGWLRFDNDDSEEPSEKICLLRNSLEVGLIWEGHLVPFEGKTVDYEGQKLQCYLTMNDAFTYYYEGEAGLKKNTNIRR